MQKIKTIEILSITLIGKNHLVVKAMLNTEMVEFQFRAVYDTELRATLFERSENFRELARWNSPFEAAVHDFIKKVYAGEVLSFPITLNF